MPHSEEARRQQVEDLYACTKGHKAIYDEYEWGIHKAKALKASQDRRDRASVNIWILLFLTRKTQEVLK